MTSICREGSVRHTYATLVAHVLRRRKGEKENTYARVCVCVLLYNIIVQKYTIVHKAVTWRMIPCRGEFCTRFREFERLRLERARREGNFWATISHSPTHTRRYRNDWGTHYTSELIIKLATRRAMGNKNICSAFHNAAFQRWMRGGERMRAVVVTLRVRTRVVDARNAANHAFGNFVCVCNAFHDGRKIKYMLVACNEAFLDDRSVGRASESQSIIVERHCNSILRNSQINSHPNVLPCVLNSFWIRIHGSRRPRPGFESPRSRLYREFLKVPRNFDIRRAGDLWTLTAREFRGSFKSFDAISSVEFLCNSCSLMLTEILISDTRSDWNPVNVLKCTFFLR